MSKFQLKTEAEHNQILGELAARVVEDMLKAAELNFEGMEKLDLHVGMSEAELAALAADYGVEPQYYLSLAVTLAMQCIYELAIEEAEATGAELPEEFYESSKILDAPEVIQQAIEQKVRLV